MEYTRQHGLPPRGSVQDRVVCEMLYRSRRSTLMQSVYLGKLLAVGTGIPEKLLSSWTTLLSLEINHDNYKPNIVKQKKDAIDWLVLNEQREHINYVQSTQKLDKLTVTGDNDRAATPEELAEYKRQMRRKHLQNKRRP